MDVGVCFTLKRALIPFANRTTFNLYRSPQYRLQSLETWSLTYSPRVSWSIHFTPGIYETCARSNFTSGGTRGNLYWRMRGRGDPALRVGALATKGGSPVQQGSLASKGGSSVQQRALASKGVATLRQGALVNQGASTVYRSGTLYAKGSTRGRRYGSTARWWDVRKTA